MIWKTTLREIKSSLGRYIAILAIVALGVGFFCGLKVTKEAMITTTDDYLQKEKMFDYQLISTLGYEKVDVNNISKLSCVETADGSISTDVLCSYSDGVDRVLKASSVSASINILQIDEGRLPNKGNECFADGRLYSKKDIGKEIILSNNNTNETKEKFKYNKYTIVGIGQSPIYLNFERGSTSLGNGNLSGFFYIPEEGFKINYYTEIYLTLKGNNQIYSSAYKSLVKESKTPITKAAESGTTRRYNAIVKSAKDKLYKAEKAYTIGLDKYNNNYKQTSFKLKSNYNKLLNANKLLSNQETKLNDNKKRLENAKNTVLVALKKIQQEKKQLEDSQSLMPPDQYEAALEQLTNTENELKSKLTETTLGLSQINEGQRALAKKRIELTRSWNSYYSGKAIAEEELASAKEKLNEAKESINAAKSKIEDIQEGKTYVLNRNSNIGYSCFESDSNIVDDVAKVFPIFFFLVAALVCMTTMTRMIDEQRTQIGIFKALGYSNKTIMGKYLFYSGSAATIGAVIGYLGGCYLFPLVIWKSYGIMYDFNNQVNYILNPGLAAIAIISALVCSMGSTIFSCLNDFRIVPAELIRPKSPKNGKRILLERITFIWKKISFLYKVTLRNIFRYKKRFLMMVLGISGCTALLVTGLGVNDSVKNIVDFQYDEIMQYDYSIIYENNQTIQEQQKFTQNSDKYIKDIVFLHEGSADCIYRGKTKSIQLIVADGNDISRFVNLHIGNKKLSYPTDGQAIICEKLSNQYNISIGDSITLRDSDMNTMKVKVTSICENYVYNYVYVSPSTCNSGWGYIPEYKSAFVKASPSDESSNDKNSYIYKSAAKISNMDGVIGTIVNQDIRTRVKSMMESLNAVILLIVLSAGALAFIVLYNLTNINITERIREIATIKVLGFYPKEVSAYVFRENFVLTGISAIFGLFLGKILHAFVMSQIKVDMISFDVRITTFSYILSFILTFVFAILVSMVMFFKLKRISMTESLKSIE